ncbi:MAG: S-adenosyl-l-methionine hydroxide adenosyltransferase family protein, partial [Candidatus Kapaibacterium sp.]
MIALISDFGTQDAYVGIMKGVIKEIAYDCPIVDINNNIPRHDIHAAAYNLAASVSYFPEKTIFLCVVDPGVGTNRKALIMNAGNKLFVAPDNGLLSYVISELSPDKIISIENKKYMLEKVSNTFHGRDVFAPAAAHLFNNTSISSFGPELRKEELDFLPEYKKIEKTESTINGHVIYIDIFGNLITNIKESCLNGNGYKVVIHNRILEGLKKSYGDVAKGKPLA